MEDCHFGADCPVMERRLSKLPGIADLFRSRYCDGDHTLCARHRLADMVGRPGVPDSLMPNDHDAASQLVRGYAFPN